MSVSLQQPVAPVDADVAAARPPRPRAALAVAMSGFAIALLIVPVGVGGSFAVPIASLLPGAVAARQAGIASGVLDTFWQMGGSFGVAVYGAIVAAQSSLLHGLRISLTAIVLAVTAAITLTVRRAAAQWHHPQERCTPQPLGRTTRCRQSR